jgi:PKHD-type hydroxylase
VSANTALEATLRKLIQAEDLSTRSIAPIRFVGAFSRFECEAIKALGCAEPPVVGMMQIPVEGYRQCAISELLVTSENQWLAAKIWTIAEKANVQYGFDLTHDLLSIQYTHYEQNGKVGWHSDYDFQSLQPRKISLSIQLTDPTEYDGGSLEFFPSGELPLSRGQGTAIAFPSFATHRVTEVTRGERTALVVWLTGPLFR